MEAPQKIKNRTTIWSNNSSPGYFITKMRTLVQKDKWTPMFSAALFTIAKIWKKQPKCSSMDEWIKNMRYMYTMECYSTTKKKIAISNNMNGYYCYYAKQNKSNKYHISSVICGSLKKKKKKKAIGYRKQEWWLPEATRVECGENWVKGVKKVKV